MTNIRVDVVNKVTFLISSLSGGGAEAVCVNIANGLASRGWQVTLLVLHMKNSAYHDRVSKQVDLLALGVNNARYSFGKLRKYIQTQKPTQMVVFNYELAVMMVLVRLLSQDKFRLIARNISILSQKRELASGIWYRYIVRAFIDRFYTKVDHIVNQCEAMRVDLLEVYELDKEKTSVIYNPVNEIVQNYVNLHGIEDQKEGYFLCIGRLERVKAFRYAIEAFAGVASELPHMRLKIVGKGSLELELKNFAKSLGLANRVDFEGFQKDVLPYYAKADATLLTSLYEGFPNVLIESIVLGTPVVAFDSPGGVKEIVQDGVNGYLVEYQNIKELENKMKEAANKKWDRYEVAKSAQKFSLSIALDRWEELLDS
ncbi:MAG TPA: glycosyltransferase [Epsilonproteobacteria bacterium]|nr:glycosyltransferase [Campylobacterota bacterium]